MALDNKKSGFGFDMDERLKGAGKMDDVTPTSTLTSTPMKENKTKRLYATVKPSTFAKLEAYAARKGDSVNNLVNELLEAFIEKEGL